jgi:hypothetical protein
VQTSAQLFAALETMLETNEFDYAVLDLNVSQFSIGPDNATHTIWSWRRESVEPDEGIYDELFDDQTSARWMLSLPLTDEAGNGIGLMTFHRKLTANALTIDLKHLCGEFQRELSAALLRVSGEGLHT